MGDLIRRRVKAKFGGAVSKEERDHAASENEPVEIKLRQKSGMLLQHFEKLRVEVEVLNGKSRLLAFLKVGVDQSENRLEDFDVISR